MEDILLASDFVQDKISQKIKKKLEPKTIQNDFVVNKYLRIKAVLLSEHSAGFFIGYKTGDCSNDLFYKTLINRKAQHIHELGCEPNDYKTGFNNVIFHFKGKNINFINRKKSPCMATDLYDKPVMLEIKTILYNVKNKDKANTGMSLQVRRVEEL